MTRPVVEQDDFRLLVASTRDYAIFMLDPEGNILTWNAGAERIKGYKPDEIIGKNFSTFYMKHDVDRGHPQDELRQAIRDGRYEEEGWRVRKDGSRFWANVVITALRNDKGELRGFAKVTRDLTERKRAEEELKKAYAELEAFSYSVSHDLRAPLRSMDGFSDVLLKRYADKLDDRGKDYLRRIRESAQRMAQLIDTLLDLSRIGRAEIRREDVDVTRLVTEVAAELRKAEPARELEVVVQPGMRASADPKLLRVVYENLLANAFKYTSRHDRARVEAGTREARGDTEYFVRDDGAGFDMAYAEKLFGAFQRLHGVDEFPGIGIGLATVRRIIHRHGGEIHAVGEPERGATFTFTLGKT